MCAESGQVLYLAVLYLADAYAHFTKLVRERNLDVIKRSDFKGLVVPLIHEQFGVRLRNDLVVDERGGVRGWKNVKLPKPSIVICRVDNYLFPMI